jgi:hypothetical protein
MLVLSVLLLLAEPKPTPEAKAVAWLVREVPTWSPDNRCFSCHHNGDGARVLYQARRLGFTVPDKSLDDTTRWLTRPGDWDNNGTEGGASDRTLARLQWAAALASAGEAGVVKERAALEKAADFVAAQQRKDGSFTVEAEGSIGSPATHGVALATVLARRTLAFVDRRKHEQAIALADTWLRQREVKTVLDAASVLWGLEKADDAGAKKQRQACLEMIRKGEAKDGGWGPYLRSAPEPFDTAVVLLALSSQAPTDEIKAMLRRGRAWLIAAQEEDGCWPETTRPAGNVSYPQRTSTAAWATQALLATRE